MVELVSGTSIYRIYIISYRTFGIQNIESKSWLMNQRKSCSSCRFVKPGKSGEMRSSATIAVEEFNRPLWFQLALNKRCLCGMTWFIHNSLIHDPSLQDECMQGVWAGGATPVSLTVVSLVVCWSWTETPPSMGSVACGWVDFPVGEGDYHGVVQVRHVTCSSLMFKALSPHFLGFILPLASP